MKIHSLFPWPVYTDTFNSDLNLIQFLDQNPQNDFGKTAAGEAGTYSTNTQILRSEQCVELRQFILTSSLKYVRECLGYDVKEMVDVLSWVSIKKTNEQHSLHHHPNSFVSGVYYYDDVAQKTPLIFQRMRSNPVGSYEIDIGPRIDPFPKTAMPFCDVYKIQPTKGDLILFPSFLFHRVPRNQTENERKSVAFNIMPINQLGSERTLTQFHYHVD